MLRTVPRLTVLNLLLLYRYLPVLYNAVIITVCVSKLQSDHLLLLYTNLLLPYITLAGNVQCITC